MRVRYVYSACVVIETPDVTVCCDPWFTPGAYDGSWIQYPPLTRDPVQVIGPVDCIYVSHIHPDHYDPGFLHRYLAVYPGTRLLIGDTDPPHLARKMGVDGLKPEVVSTLSAGRTQLSVIPNHAFAEQDNVDTALVVTRDGRSVVNMNDNPIDDMQVASIREAAGAEVSVALLPYSGAGPFPQTYEFDTHEELWAAAEGKKERFLSLFDRYIELLDPRCAIPFAGKYLLAGPLRGLNSLRGVPDAVEAARRAGTRAVVLADGGDAFIDVDTLVANAVREDVYEAAEIDRYLDDFDFPGYDYEREINPIGGRQLPLAPLLAAAYERAIQRTRVQEPFYFCISTNGGASFFCFDTCQASGISVRARVDDLEPRCEIFIDSRYLFGLLTRMYHWNNAEIGSHYRARRVPTTYRRDAYGFLHFFHV